MGDASRPSVSDRSGTLLPWTPVLVGFGATVGLLMTALAFPFVLSTVHTAARGPAVVSPSQQQTSGETDEGDDRAPAVTPPTSPCPDGSASPSDCPSPDGSVSPSEPDVVAAYGRATVFKGAFIGEVLIANPSPRSRDWKITLKFAGEVGELDSFWVEAAPQPTLRQQGKAYVFISAAPVPAGYSVTLRFQFRGFEPETDVIPKVCMINGASCVIRP